MSEPKLCCTVIRIDMHHNFISNWNPEKMKQTYLKITWKFGHQLYSVTLEKNRWIYANPTYNTIYLSFKEKGELNKTLLYEHWISNMLTCWCVFMFNFENPLIFFFLVFKWVWDKSKNQSILTVSVLSQTCYPGRRWNGAFFSKWCNWF